MVEECVQDLAGIDVEPPNFAEEIDKTLKNGLRLIMVAKDHKPINYEVANDQSGTSMFKRTEDENPIRKKLTASWRAKEEGILRDVDVRINNWAESVKTKVVQEVKADNAASV